MREGESRLSLPKRSTATDVARTTRRLASLSIALLLLSAMSLGQVGARSPIRTEDELLSALLWLKPDDQLTAQALLLDHASLMSKRLCDSLTQAAFLSLEIGNSPRATFRCGIGEPAAARLTG